jgi:hypothetical protein
MAKYGNFVAQRDLALTEEEKQMFLDFFKEKLFITYGKYGFEKIFTEISVSEDCYTTVTDFKIYHFNFMVEKPLSGRNYKGDRVPDFKGITFLIRKKIGYLEVKGEYGLPLRDENGKIVKDYENAPTFQYSLSVDVNGHKIPYKCRNKELICLKDSFQYDTDIENFDFSIMFRSLSQNIGGLK